MSVDRKSKGSEAPLKVFSAKFQGVYLGGFAVVVARDEGTARRHVQAMLVDQHITENQNEDVVIEEVLTDDPVCVLLWDGDY